MDLLSRAKYEASEDRRIAALCRTERARDVLLQRAQVTDDLIAEVERLRAGGPWVEHVERMEAMKRTRDQCRYCTQPGATIAFPHVDHRRRKPWPQPYWLCAEHTTDLT